jgi:hypothetical protein
LANLIELQRLSFFDAPVIKDLFRWEGLLVALVRQKPRLLLGQKLSAISPAHAACDAHLEN